MDYKEAWEDMRRWLNQGIEYLDGREKELRQEGEDIYAHIRVSGKLNGLKTSLYHMDETEKIYGDDK